MIFLPDHVLYIFVWFMVILFMPTLTPSQVFLHQKRWAKVIRGQEPSLPGGIEVTNNEHTSTRTDENYVLMILKFEINMFETCLIQETCLKHFEIKIMGEIQFILGPLGMTIFEVFAKTLTIRSGSAESNGWSPKHQRGWNGMWYVEKTKVTQTFEKITSSLALKILIMMFSLLYLFLDGRLLKTDIPLPWGLAGP